MSVKSLEKKIIAQIKEKVKTPENVKIIYFRERGKYQKEADEIVEILKKAGLDVIITDGKNKELREKYNVFLGGIAFVVTDNEEKYKLKYLGTPGGLEIRSLMDVIRYVSQGDPELTPETIELLSKIKNPAKIVVFVTPTCPYCPNMVTLAHRFAMANPLLDSSMVEAIEHPDYANRFNVSAVPRTVINDKFAMDGLLEENVFRNILAKALKLTPTIKYFRCKKCGLIFASKTVPKECPVKIGCKPEDLEEISEEDFPKYRKEILAADYIVNASKLVLDTMVDMFPELKELAQHLLADMLGLPSRKHH